MERVLHYSKFGDVSNFTFKDTGLSNKYVDFIYQTVALDADGNELGPFFQGPPLPFRVIKRQIFAGHTFYKLIFEPGKCVEHEHRHVSKFVDTKWTGKSEHGKIMYDFMRRIEDAVQNQLVDASDETGSSKKGKRFSEWLFSGTKYDEEDGVEGTGDGFRIDFDLLSGVNANVFDVFGRPVHELNPKNLDGWTVIPLFELPLLFINKVSRAVSPGLIPVRQFVLVENEKGEFCDLDQFCKCRITRPN
nr:hypothetical protein [Sicyoidochytrium minutum DNA virus]